MTSRRLTFQLTPLLDLLLIVIFAQFLEVKETTATQEQQATVQISDTTAELDRARAKLADLQTRAAAAQAELEAAQKLLTDEQLSSDSLRLEKDALEKALAKASEQRDTIAGLMPELFDLPDETVRELIRTRTPENVRLTPEQVQQLREEFREFAKQKPGEAVRHLLTFDEMRKRCDIWELYVDSTGKTVFSAGQRTFEFRADSAAQFQRELFENYKSLPQPKSLVILLLSYGDVKASVYQAAIDGLPKAADQMREDQSGRSRFEYAILGFNPTPIATPPLPD